MVAANYTLSVDPAQMADLLETVGAIRKGPQTVVTNAVNATLRTGRSRIIGRLGKILNLRLHGVGEGSRAEAKLLAAGKDARPPAIGDYVSLRKANHDTLQGAITLRREEIPLGKFDPQKAPGGVTVKVRKSRGRELIKDAFISRMKSGHLGVFRRAKAVAFESLMPHEKVHYKAGMLHFRQSRLVTTKARTRVGRLPIEETFGGPTPLGVFENAPGVAAEVMAELGGELEKNVASQADRLLNPRANDARSRATRAGEEPTDKGAAS